MSYQIISRLLQTRGRKPTKYPLKDTGMYIIYVFIFGTRIREYLVQPVQRMERQNTSLPVCTDPQLRLGTSIVSVKECLPYLGLRPVVAMFTVYCTTGSVR